LVSGFLGKSSDSLNAVPQIFFATPTVPGGFAVPFNLSSWWT
jgi:hypothetical protein